MKQKKGKKKRLRKSFPLRKEHEKKSLSLSLSLSSLALDRPVHPPHEGQARPPPDKAQHQREGPAGDASVPEIKGTLHEPFHVRLREEEVERIPGDEEARRGAAGEGAPPPPVVLGGELDCVDERKKRSRREKNRVGGWVGGTGERVFLEKEGPAGRQRKRAQKKKQKPKMYSQ